MRKTLLIISLIASRGKRKKERALRIKFHPRFFKVNFNSKASRNIFYLSKGVKDFLHKDGVIPKP